MKTTKLTQAVPIEKRGAGILMHITSLPSAFGIGDMGPQARSFADFLFRSKQRCWQILPLGPIEASQLFSPYSSSSSMAGNVLLISPELMRDDGLLTDAQLKKAVLRNNGKVRYEDVTQSKEALFQNAFTKFKSMPAGAMHRQFDMFCDEESGWLDKFAQYTVLKTIYKKPWSDWPTEFKNAEPDKLESFSRKNAVEIEKTKWLQFIFTRQWEQLRFYCNQLNISLYGDLPFYVSYDSADVWAHPQYFALDSERNIKCMAGVPPDYFNEDGQLWGMPTFNWKALSENNFDWWIARLKKNIELFDKIRLDHFRAFESYWEVKAGEANARNGRWVAGPGSKFFEAVQKKLGGLPFIAEDLGDVDAAVFTLRDKFHLPGMKVLQFAFSGEVGESTHAPHQYSSNFVAYTGTHDNNTTVGWFRKELGRKFKPALSEYLGKKITEGNVHEELARATYRSVATMVIIPMQDLLGLDESARMNKPASLSGNWSWRLREQKLSFPKIEAQLQLWTQLYAR